MKRIIVLAAALLLMSLALMARPALASFEIGYFNDFQQTLKPFVLGSIPGACPAADSLRLEFERQASALPGGGFAALTSGCSHTIWMQAALPGDGNPVLVQFDAKAMDGCQGCIPIAYFGDRAPTAPGQFTTDYQTLNNIWQTHRFIFDPGPAPLTGPGSPQDPAANRVVAIGFANLDEGIGHSEGMGIDNVSVTLYGGKGN